MLEPVLSHYQIAPLLSMRVLNDLPVQAQMSLDLGLSQTEITADHEGLHILDRLLAWEDAAVIAGADVSCYALIQGSTDTAWAIEKIQTFSETTNRHVSLMPTAGAPTLLIAGFPMHRIKDIDPLRDTLNKIRAARPTGLVFDTSMGLGYTAIEAAKRAERVIVTEIDPAVVTIAARNPYSRDLFASPKIELRIQDSTEALSAFDDDTFDRIIHDPPTFALAGELYSGAYYRELYRVLKRGGRLFHYIGDLNSPSVLRVVRGVTERLSSAGFKNIAKRYEAFGVIAFK